MIVVIVIVAMIVTVDEIATVRTEVVWTELAALNATNVENEVTLLEIAEVDVAQVEIVLIETVTEKIDEAVTDVIHVVHPDGTHEATQEAPQEIIISQDRNVIVAHQSVETADHQNVQDLVQDLQEGIQDLQKEETAAAEIDHPRMVVLIVTPLQMVIVQPVTHQNNVRPGRQATEETVLMVTQMEPPMAVLRWIKATMNKPFLTLSLFNLYIGAFTAI